MRKLLLGFATLSALEGLALGAALMGLNAKAETTTTTETAVETTIDTPYEGSLEFYKELSNDLGLVELYDSSELTVEDLQARDGRLIIERVIGIVENSEGDGKVLNPNDENQDYINYSRVDGFEPGNVIATYLVYDPECNAEDCTVARYDYIIDSKTCLDE